MTGGQCWTALCRFTLQMAAHARSSRLVCVGPVLVSVSVNPVSPAGRHGDCEDAHMLHSNLHLKRLRRAAPRHHRVFVGKRTLGHSGFIIGVSVWIVLLIHSALRLEEIKG